MPVKGLLSDLFQYRDHDFNVCSDRGLKAGWRNPSGLWGLFCCISGYWIHLNENVVNGGGIAVALVTATGDLYVLVVTVQIHGNKLCHADKVLGIIILNMLYRKVTASIQ